MDQPTAFALREVGQNDAPSAPGLNDAIRSSLDLLRTRFLSGDVIAGMRDLSEALGKVRRQLGQAAWRDMAAETILTHEIADVIFQCPLTSRSKEKPRGYAGDAELLDHIYGLGSAQRAPHPATISGQIYFYTVNSPACKAVRRRREILADEIDKAAARTAPREANMLSIACGHLREADLSAAVRGGSIGRFVALDQDKDSLAEVERSYGPLGVVTQEGTVRSIIAGKSAFADMDFVYAAGLLDYLVEPVAMRLIERMFGFLRPGGRLLVANFTPAVPDLGYMETFMDWRLILRNADELGALFDRLPFEQVASLETFEDDPGAIAYATVFKTQR